MENRLSGAQTIAALAAGPESSLPIHRYEFLFEMTTQLLAAQSLDEQTSLVLDTITSGLGYASAAIALADRQRGVLRMRGASGFADDAASSSLELPLDSNAPHVKIVHDGRPAWLAREGDEAAADFLRRIGSHTDVLALPLFGGQLQTGRGTGGAPFRTPDDERSWPSQLLCVGALYVGASRSEEHTSELQSQSNLVCRLLLEKKKIDTLGHRS